MAAAAGSIFATTRSALPVPVNGSRAVAPALWSGLPRMVRGELVRVDEVLVVQLFEHIEALHAKSGRLLATAEGAGCDAAFVESLARMDRHLAGLLAAVTRPR